MTAVKKDKTSAFRTCDVVYSLHNVNGNTCKFECGTEVRSVITQAFPLYFQSQNILDLLDVGPAPVNPTTNGEKPSTGGATDLLGLLGDVASISNPGTGYLLKISCWCLSIHVHTVHVRHPY